MTAVAEMPRIVIVDDDARLRGSLRGLLEELGFVVLGVGGDGHQAIALTRTLRPDVALLDLRMPGLDGIEAARRIRGLGTPTKTVILSAYDDPALGEEARDVGVYAYLVKGCSADMIRDVLLAAWSFDAERT